MLLKISKHYHMDMLQMPAIEQSKHQEHVVAARCLAMQKCARQKHRRVRSHMTYISEVLMADSMQGKHCSFKEDVYVLP